MTLTHSSFQAKECHNHLENAILSKLPVEILMGKKNLEVCRFSVGLTMQVRPQLINKGEIVKKLLHKTPNADSISCAGDDKTDEDMFKAIRRANLVDASVFTCTIGSATKKSQASHHVPYTPLFCV
jgi:trehalose 6-phosphate synthase/phosphatase